MTRNRPYRFAWRGGNRVDLLVDGERFFPAMLAAIEQARRLVLLEMYLFESGRVADRFIEALTAAARRGVEVYLLLDHFGAGALSRHDRQGLAAAGVRIAWYNPLRYGHLRRNLFRDHRKLLLVDGSVAYVGGAGITDEFAADTASGPPWHDAMLQVHGPCVGDWHALFADNWRRWGDGTVPEHRPGDGATPAGEQLGRVSANEPVRMEVKRSLLKRLRGAERRIWLATAYFLPSRKLRRALRLAVRRGVDVRLLLPGPHSDVPPVRLAGRRYYQRLLRHGVRIYEYQPRFLHAKVLLCDQWASVGSSNVDRWNLRWNLEANQEVEDQAFAAMVERFFRDDFDACREMDLATWQHRSWRERLAERFWGLVERWLARHSESGRDGLD